MLGRLFDNPTHLLILVVILVVVFGAKRLPDAARSLGRSTRIFKAEIKDMKDDGKAGSSAAAGTPSRPLEGKVVDGTSEAPRTESRPAPAPASDTADVPRAESFPDSTRHTA
jgi:sec-independent protein translocase protein TatA